jgi:broad specificity phosphatase PhoE
LYTWGKMLLSFYRHGKSVDAESGLSQHPDSPLTDESKEKLRALSESDEVGEYDAVYTSTYVRAKQTAEALFGKDAFQILEFVHESDMTPHLYGKSAAVAFKYWEELDNEKKEDPHYRHDPRGETFQEVVERTQLFMNFIHENHQDSDKVALVGHGIFIRLLLAQLMMGDNFNYKSYVQTFIMMRLENGASITIEYNLETKKMIIREMKNWEIM